MVCIYIYIYSAYIFGTTIFCRNISKEQMFFIHINNILNHVFCICYIHVVLQACNNMVQYENNEAWSLRSFYLNMYFSRFCTINNLFFKTYFAKRCRNQMCKHSLPLWLKLNNAVNIRIVYFYWFYMIAHFFFEILLPIKYVVLSVLTLKHKQKL